MGKGLDNYIGNHDNILLLGDFNSEFSKPCLNDFCDIYNFKNLVKKPTCYKNPDNPSCIDLFLANRPRTFQCTITIETGISDFHKLVVTVLKNFIKSKDLKPFVTGVIWILRTATFAKKGIIEVWCYKSVLDKHATKKWNIYVQRITILWLKNLEKQLWTDQN